MRPDPEGSFVARTASSTGFPHAVVGFPKWVLCGGLVFGSFRKLVSETPIYLEAHTLPPFLGRLLFKITDPNHKTRYPQKGVGFRV